MINKFNNLLFLQILGALFIFIFLWIRFIKERLPQNIPIQLSFTLFLFLLFVNIIYVYIIYRTFILTHSQLTLLKLFEPIIIILTKPLVLFYSFLLTNSYSRKILIILSRLTLNLLSLRKHSSDSLYIYSFVFIFPKTIFALCFIIDCVYNKQLYLIYWCVFIISLPLLIKYLLYSSEYLYDIDKLEKYFLIEITSKDLIYEETDYDAQGFLEDHLPVRFWELHHMNFDIEPEGLRYNYLKLHKFIEYQSIEINLFNLPHEYKILFQDEREDILFLSEKPSRHPSLSKKDCEDIVFFKINIIVLKGVINFVRKYYFNNKANFNRLTFFLNISNGVILVCWIYILIKSVHTLPQGCFDWLIYLIPKYENPFI